MSRNTLRRRRRRTSNYTNQDQGSRGRVTRKLNSSRHRYCVHDAPRGGQLQPVSGLPGGISLSAASRYPRDERVAPGDRRHPRGRWGTEHRAGDKRPERWTKSALRCAFQFATSPTRETINTASAPGGRGFGERWRRRASLHGQPAPPGPLGRGPEGAAMMRRGGGHEVRNGYAG